ncbi:g3149 [Coccomyxa elongata]
MSLRLVKQQLSALSSIAEELAHQPGKDKGSTKVIRKKDKVKKKQHKKGKAAAKKALSEEEIERRNLDYYKKTTTTTSKATEAMNQALALLPGSGGSSTQIKSH